MPLGVFCITPRKGIFQESDGQVGLDWDVVQFLNEHRQVDGFRLLADPFMRLLFLPRGEDDEDLDQADE